MRKYRWFDLGQPGTDRANEVLDQFHRKAELVSPERRMELAGVFLPKRAAGLGEHPEGSIWANIKPPVSQAMIDRCGLLSDALMIAAANLIPGSRVYFDDAVYQGRAFEDRHGDPVVPEDKRLYRLVPDQLSQWVVQELTDYCSCEWVGCGVVCDGEGPESHPMLMLCSIFDREATMWACTRHFAENHLPGIMTRLKVTEAPFFI